MVNIVIEIYRRIIQSVQQTLIQVVELKSLWLRQYGHQEFCYIVDNHKWPSLPHMIWKSFLISAHVRSKWHFFFIWYLIRWIDTLTRQLTLLQFIFLVVGLSDYFKVAQHQIISIPIRGLNSWFISLIHFLNLLSMKLCSWNINGLKAFTNKITTNNGLINYLNSFDVICLQETRCHIDNFNKFNYHATFD